MEKKWLENVEYQSENSMLSLADSDKDSLLKNNLVSQTATGWFVLDDLIEGKIESRYTVDEKEIIVTVDGKFKNKQLIEGKKYINDTLVMSANIDAFGKHCISNYDNDEVIVRKTYYNPNNIWIKTEYYDNGALERLKEIDLDKGITLFKRFHPVTGKQILNGYLIENREINMTESLKLKNNGFPFEIYDIANNLVYVGQCNGYVPNGEGKYYSELNFLEYEGHYLNGKRDGVGKTYYLSKDKKDSYSPHLLYDGSFKNGLYDGNGILYNQELNNGSKLYEGEFVEGKFVEGKQYYNDTVVYDGQFSGVAPDGHFYYDGKGEQFYINGQLRFKGLFSFDKFCGEAIVYNQDGSILFEGNLDNGLPNDKAIFHLNDGSTINASFDAPLGNEKCYKITHIDKDSNIIFSGFGCFIYDSNILGLADITTYNKEKECTVYLDNGEKFIGEFIHNSKNGRGKFYFSNGSIKSDCGYIGDILNSKCVEFDENKNEVFSGNFNNGLCVDGKGKFVLADNTIYEGKIENYYKNGEGKLYTSDNNLIYSGKFKEDLYDSTGTLYFENSTVHYNGSFKNGLFDGEGELFNIDSTLTYKGEFVNGLRSGNGKQIYSDKSYYIGAFENDLRNGQGKLYSEDNTLIYDGLFADDKFNGFGKYYLNTIYFGDFKDNKFHGNGKLFYSDDKIQYDAEFIDGTITGHCKEYDKDGILRFDGEFINGTYGSFGTIFYSNGDKYTGELSNSVKNGSGTYFYSNGNTAYQGQYLNAKRNGEGTSYDINGNIYYKGSWVDGIKSGKGMLYNNKGMLIYNGDFVDNIYSGYGQLCNDNGMLYYEGEFKNGKRNGKGLHYANNSQVDYDGFYVDDVRNGFGVSYFADTSTPFYRGYWKDGLFDGCGIIYNEGKVALVGRFSKGKLNGRVNKIENDIVVAECLYKDGELTYQRTFDVTGLVLFEGHISNGEYDGLCKLCDNTGKLIHEGEFENGHFSKNKCFVSVNLTNLPNLTDENMTIFNAYIKNKCQYVTDYHLIENALFYGILEDDKPSGIGKLIYSNGTIYIGEFTDILPTGVGKLEFSDGSAYNGDVVNAVPFGNGRYRSADNFIYEGNFENGKRSGNFTITNPMGIKLTADYDNDVQISVPKAVNDTQLTNQ